MSSIAFRRGRASGLRAIGNADADLLKHFDWVMFAATLLIVSFGIMMIYSTTTAAGPLVLNLVVLKQLIYGGVGLILMGILASIDYRFLANWTWVMYVVMLGLLALIFVIGRETFGSTRWIDIGPVALQPSELGKLVMVLVLAKFLADRPRGRSNLVRFLISLGLIALPFGLVFLQPDLGTSLVLAAVWVAMTLVSGTRWKYLVTLAALALPSGLVAWLWLLRPYQIARVIVFLNPEASELDGGYNIIQARISMGNGGLTGQGFMGGTQGQLDYLRVQHTDFIASVIGEEFGFVGMIALLLVYGLLLWRMIRVARLARDEYGELIAAGITTTFLFQIFVNVGMNMQLMPVTGIPLPLISYGGSSLVTLLAAQGILQSILMRHKKLNT
ncbi:MAG: rod shape-determining protein RodA [Chloroflexia bacterium]|nr:rod shape-determining protein RodA [Chloroflexia bacterium]